MKKKLTKYLKQNYQTFEKIICIYIKCWPFVKQIISYSKNVNKASKKTFKCIQEMLIIY